MARIKEPRQTTWSVVGERLIFLQGKPVAVTMADFERPEGQETFQGIYVDTIPCGREYFYVFRVGEKRRLIRTTSVIQIIEL